jgi:hypothetical protein
VARHDKEHNNWSHRLRFRVVWEGDGVFLRPSKVELAGKSSYVTPWWEER